MCFSDLENIECLMQKRNKARLVTEEGRRGQKSLLRKRCSVQFSHVERD